MGKDEPYRFRNDYVIERKEKKKSNVYLIRNYRIQLHKKNWLNKLHNILNQLKEKYLLNFSKHRNIKNQYNFTEMI